jgi:hypothetical protein
MALNHDDTVSESLVQDATRQKLGDYNLVTNLMMHPAEFLEKEAAEEAAKLAIAGPILGSSHSQREKKESETGSAMPQRNYETDLVTNLHETPAEFFDKQAAIKRQIEELERKDKAHGSLGSSHSQRAQQDNKTSSVMQQEQQDNHYSDLNYNDAKKKIMAKLAGMGDAVREAAVKMTKRVTGRMFELLATSVWSRLDKGMYIHR